MALVTLQEAKDILGITDTDSDAQITDLLDPASKAFVTITGADIEPTDRVEYHDGRGARSIVLRHRPVILDDDNHPFQIWDDLARNFTDGTLLDSDLYVVDDQAGIVEIVASYPASIQGWALYGSRNGFFQNGTKNVKVSYYSGLATIPQDVKFVVADLISVALADTSSGPVGEHIGSFSYYYSSTVTSKLSDASDAIIAAWKRWSPGG